MKYVLILLLVLSLVFLTGCGVVTGSVDFGFIKIPSVLIIVAILVYLIIRRKK